MKTIVCALFLTLLARSAAAQSCPDSLFVANNASFGFGLGSLSYTFSGGNQQLGGFNPATTTTLSNGQLQCLYKPHRAIVLAQASTTLHGDYVASSTSNSWNVCRKVTGRLQCRTMTCPSTIKVGPIDLAADDNGEEQSLPSNGWSMSATGLSQTLPFDSAGTQGLQLSCYYAAFQPFTVTVNPPRSFSSASCSGFYSARDTASARLSQCPGLQDAMVWEDGSGNLFNYSGYGYAGWTQAQKTRLDQIYAAISTNASDLGLDCPDPQKQLFTLEQTLDASGNPLRNANVAPVDLLFTANQAFDTYAAGVAWSLYVAAHRLVPWSILDSPAIEVAEYYDSRHAHSRITAEEPAGLGSYPASIVAGRDFWNAGSRGGYAWEAVCDPRIGYQFLSGQYSSSQQSLIGADALTTLKNLTAWFYDNVAHGSPTDITTSFVLANNRIYLSDRLQASSRSGSSSLVWADLGCHSAASLFYDLAKSVNLPLQHTTMAQPNSASPIDVSNNAHGALVYGWGTPSSTLILEHVDDIYAEYGEILPIDSNNQPITDVTQPLFSATWLPPSTLTAWGMTLTNDYGLQTPTTRYGTTVANLPAADEGPFVGYWPPASGSNPQANQLLLATAGTLCSYRGFTAVVDACSTDDPTYYQNNWLSLIGQTSLNTPTGVETAQAYLTHLQTCAAAYTNLSPVAACTSLAYPNTLLTKLQNRAATDYWTGPLGK
jgi:hypothetical protein